MSWAETHSHTSPGQATAQIYDFIGTSYTTCTPEQTYTWTNTRKFWVDPKRYYYSPGLARLITLLGFGMVVLGEKKADELILVRQ